VWCSNLFVQCEYGVFARWRQRDEIFKQKVNDCSAYNIAEVHQFPCNSVMEFSEYLQWDRIGFLRHPLVKGWLHVCSSVPQWYVFIMLYYAGIAVFPMCSTGWSSVWRMGPKTISYSHCDLHMRSSAVDEYKSNVSVLLFSFICYILMHCIIILLYYFKNCIHFNPASGCQNGSKLVCAYCVYKLSFSL